ncbi:MAG TPA: acyl-CoA dehydrogenase family protein [Crenalkalicoccus sp.]|nr:acyl-CoA dehydrogenase family protein [Crenalkalicoccus sp.]
MALLAAAASPRAEAFRREVRAFLAEELERGSFVFGRGGFDPEFSRRMGARGLLGLTWPREYGGHERSALERHVMTEEVLAHGAPVRAHWVADRQSGPSILRFGTEAQKREFLPRIAAGELYFCIGMSEPDSGSDLASIRTRARQVEGGWRIEGRKIWTSNAHRVQMMILFARTAPPGEDRHAGVSQFLVATDSPGITIRPVINLAGQHDFNEVTFDDVFVPDDRVLGTIGEGWKQVTGELVFERSAPDRWLSTQPVLTGLVDHLGKDAPAEADGAVGRLVAHLWTLRQMSLGIARIVEEGGQPQVEAALVKDLGTTYEQEVPEVARRLLSEEALAGLPQGDDYARVLATGQLHAPSFSIRGGTREVLRGIVARGLGLR